MAIEKIIRGLDTSEIIEELSNSFLQSYQEDLGKSMKASNLVLDFVDGLCYGCHNVNLKRGGSYIENPGWLKKSMPQMFSVCGSSCNES